MSETHTETPLPDPFPATETEQAPRKYTGFDIARQRLFRPCKTCETPVHVNSSACKGCGGPTPWPPKPKRRAHAHRKHPRPRDPLMGVSPKQVGTPFVPSEPVEDPASIVHVAIADFSQMVGIQMERVPKGQVISEPHRIREFLANKQPIVPARDAVGVVCCPNCNHLFSPPPPKKR